MSSDAPEFGANSIEQPCSPIPVSPMLEPPVLRNQIDPVFNMTETHTHAAPDALHFEAEPSLAAINNKGDGSSMSKPSTDLAEGRSPSSVIDDGDMADTYGEEDKIEENQQSRGGQVQAAEDGDDYAKTFDSDSIEEGEAENTSSNAVANSDLDQPSSRSPLPPVSANENTVPSPSGPSPTDASSQPIKQEISSSFAQPIIPSTQATTGINNASNPAKPSYEDIANGGIDIQQLLDNITANAENAEASKSASASSPTTNLGHSYSNSGNPSLPAHSSLPPRPQTHSKQPMHSSYVPHDDMRKFHAGPPTSFQSHGAYRPAGIPLVAGAGAPGTSTDPRNGLPPPPAASFNSPLHLQGSVQAFSPRNNHLRLSDQESGEASTTDGRDETDTPWPPRVQKQYDAFLEDERRYVTDGLWDIFPKGSRLFIGNLPTEKVTKRDIFHVFYRYGRLAQIAIKQAYGFVQFHDVAACQKALQREQGAEVRGRRMHLEISKPQKNTTNSIRPGGVRPRSPEQARGHNGRNSYGPERGPDRGAERRGSFDRYDARPNTSRWQNRDDYRPRRSPSPRGGYRGRDDYGRDEFGRDRVRPRSRSRSPYNNRREYRQRSPSPRSIEAAEDAALGIPRRNARDIPDVQIILMEELDRQFVSWVETEMRGLGLRTEVLFLNPRLSLEAVIRRQILEGVQAVTQLTHTSQMSSKIPLQLFDHTKNPVTFDRYQDLDPKIAAQLVIRAKQARVPAVPAYSTPAYLPPQQAYQPQPAAPAAQAPNIANIVGQLDNDALQKLLLSLNANSQQQNSQPPPAQQPQQTPVNIANLLSGFTQQQPQQLSSQMHYQQQLPPQNGQQQQQQNPYAALANNPNLAALLSGQGQAQPQIGQQQTMQGAPDPHVENIMAHLSRFR